LLKYTIHKNHVICSCANGKGFTPSGLLIMHFLNVESDNHCCKYTPYGNLCRQIVSTSVSEIPLATGKALLSCSFIVAESFHINAKVCNLSGVGDYYVPDY
jgi:hypothetical protein